MSETEETLYNKFTILFERLDKIRNFRENESRHGDILDTLVVPDDIAGHIRYLLLNVQLGEEHKLLEDFTRLTEMRDKLREIITDEGVFKVNSTELNWYDRVSLMIRIDLRLQKIKDLLPYHYNAYFGNRRELFIDYIINHGVPKEHRNTCIALLKAANFDVSEYEHV